MTASATKPRIEYLDRPAPGNWFVLDVMKKTSRKWDWVALMVDVDPEDLQYCVCEFPALFYVDPDAHRPGHREAHQHYLHIPGKHRNVEAAQRALEAMMATRH